MKSWIAAFRLRTLPLALSCIGMGGFLAANSGTFRGDVFFLCCLTTILLQILSNLANDYGDTVNGADHSGRQGPARAVQSGAISKEQMKTAIIVFALLALGSGLSLLWLAFGWRAQSFLFFLALGLLSILAAIAYTVGKKPYGYMGLGDISVLLFFGFVGVLGSLYLFAGRIDASEVLPALSCGLFSTAVLNINNIRDIESDLAAGKYSVPVRIGKQKAVYYHWVLLATGFISALAYALINYVSIWQLLFLPTLLLFIKNGKAVASLPSVQLDPYLRQMAMSTLLFVILFGVGLLLA